MFKGIHQTCQVFLMVLQILTLMAYILQPPYLVVTHLQRTLKVTFPPAQTQNMEVTLVLHTQVDPMVILLPLSINRLGVDQAIDTVSNDICVV